MSETETKEDLHPALAMIKSYGNMTKMFHAGIVKNMDCMLQYSYANVLAVLGFLMFPTPGNLLDPSEAQKYIDEYIQFPVVAVDSYDEAIESAAEISQVNNHLIDPPIPVCKLIIAAQEILPCGVDPESSCTVDGDGNWTFEVFARHFCLNCHFQKVMLCRFWSKHHFPKVTSGVFFTHLSFSKSDKSVFFRYLSFFRK